MIENTCKSVRRHETIDDDYFTKLFSSVSSLYHLDSLNTGAVSGKAELGPLPAESKALLGALVVVWILLGIFYLRAKQAENK
jgi:multiple sugar transport system substrate-binding protein